LDRTLWTLALGIAVVVVVLSFARQPLLGGDGEASGFSPPLTLWLAGPQSGGQAEAVAQQAASCWQRTGEPVTVGVLPGSSATAVDEFLDRVHRAPGDLLLITSTTLSDIAHDSAAAPSTTAGERAQRAVRLLANAAPVAVLGSDSLALAVRARSPIHTTAQLLSRVRREPSRPLLGIAEDTWLQGNLAALAQSTNLHGQIPYSLFRSSREAMVSLDAGEVEAIVAPHSTLREELHGGQLRELAWPATRGGGATPHAWLAIVAPQGLTPTQLTTLRAQAQHLCGGSAWTRLLRRDGLSPVSTPAPRLADFLRMHIDRANQLEALATRIVHNY